MLVPQVDIIAVGLRLIRSFGNEFDGLHRAGFDAGLFAAGTALFAPIRSVDTQVAFGGFALDMVPDSPVGLLGAHGEAGFAADALLGVDSSDVAILGIDESGARRAILDADWCDTLAAGSHLDIVRELAERVLDDLYARER